MSLLERDLEKAVVKLCGDLGFITYKFSSPSQRGVPDRIIIGPGGVLFLELKRFGEWPTKLQQYHIDRINAVGGKADWADNIIDVRVKILEVCS